MSRLGFSASLVAFALAATLLARASGDGDSRPLDAGERATFVPLVCRNAVAKSSEYACAQLIGRSGYDGQRDDRFSLDAIAYGGFTRAGADEAYVTYASALEPHAYNFGGGIVFQRTHGAWKLERWYPGLQMDRCLALPGGGRRRMLCLSGYTGQGESTESVVVHVVATSNADAATQAGLTRVLVAEDDREAAASSAPCGWNRAPNEGVLLEIKDVKRSTAPGTFATSQITYVRPGDVAKTCAKHLDFRHVKTVDGVVRFRVRGSDVEATTPIPFVPPEG